MSGPVTDRDEPPIAAEAATATGIEITAPKASRVGSLLVQRMLPRRGRRTVGPWCFADVMGPVADAASGGIGPHPHIGLQTVTWLLDGELLHRDSLGSEQPIHPGQLNLMTAGHGVAHAEESHTSGSLHGIQLWIAQPEATRHGAPAFEHHADLPGTELPGCDVTVLVGELVGARSPARCDTEHVGAELRLRGSVDIPVAPSFEHAVLAVDRDLLVDGEAVPAGHLAYAGPGRLSLALEARDPAKALLLGGVPLPDELVMWWNYVGRDRAEVREAHAAWTARDPRFGTVTSSLDPVDVGPPPWSPDR
ncbi:MAG: pirin family protein [Acidimicrobiales bacterium]